MATAKTTLIGLYNYSDSNIFSGLTFPNGIDKTVAIDTILLHGGEFEILYPDADFLPLAISSWGNRHYRTFKKWIDALSIEYDPLYNYDRTEEWTDTHTGTQKDEGSNTRTGSVKDVQKLDTKVGSKISAYDSSTLVDDTSVTTTGDPESTTTYNNLKDTSGNTRTDNLKTEHKAHIYGNIGITSSQTMLASELDIAKWNIYDHIADLFIDEFCVPVYI